MIRIAFLAIAAIFVVLTTSKAQAQTMDISGFSPEQQRWLSALTPQKVERLLRIENWKNVTEVDVVQLLRVTEVEEMEPSNVISWNQPVLKKEKVKVWFMIQTPKDFRGPQKVRLKWLLPDGDFDQKNLTIDKASPKYRMWHELRASILGKHTVQIIYDNKVIGSETFTVVKS